MAATMSTVAVEPVWRRHGVLRQKIREFNGSVEYRVKSEAWRGVPLWYVNWTSDVHWSFWVAEAEQMEATYDGTRAA